MIGRLGYGTCVLDRDLRYVTISPWMADLNGPSVEEHLGRTIGEVLPDVAAGVEPVLRGVMENCKPVLSGIVEAVTPAFPDEKRTFRHDYRPVKCAAGLVVAVKCLVQDISDQAYWDWNIVTGEMYLSPHWCQWMGFARSEVEHHIDFWDALRHPEDIEQLERVLRAHFEQKIETYECEVRLRTKSGEYLQILDRGNVVERDEDGTPLRMIGVNVDISARKSA